MTEACGKTSSSVRNASCGPVWYSRTTDVTNIAHQLGFFSTVTSLDTFLALPARLATVTAADVARVARDYLARSNRTIGWFEPVS